MGRFSGTTPAVAIGLLLLAACGSGAEEPVPTTASRAPTPSPRPTVATPARTPIPSIDVGACDSAPGPDDRFRVAAHDDGARARISEIEAALTGAIEHAGAIYGWTPTELFCVHVFSSEDSFISGLQAFLGFGDTYADTFRDNSGTVYFDWDKGRDAMFLNTSAARSIQFAATHEYLHIVQGYVEHGGAPIWFLEGLADWEATRLHGDPDPEWVSTFVDLDELGLTSKLSQLASEIQWTEADQDGAYLKSRLALVYLERIAGTGAAPTLLTNEYVLEVPDFEVALQEMTGLTIDELDRRLRPFANELTGE